MPAQSRRTLGPEHPVTLAVASVLKGPPCSIPCADVEALMPPYKRCQQMRPSRWLAVSVSAPAPAPIWFTLPLCFP